FESPHETGSGAAMMADVDNLVTVRGLTVRQVGGSGMRHGVDGQQRRGVRAWVGATSVDTDQKPSPGVHSAVATPKSSGERGAIANKQGAASRMQTLSLHALPYLLLLTALYVLPLKKWSPGEFFYQDSESENGIIRRSSDGDVDRVFVRSSTPIQTPSMPL
ncbi:hypothetical protein THAOC_13568, partial [Thalassiosira oceanica]